MLEAQEPNFVWVVKQKGSQQFVGLVSLTRHHDESHPEVSYMLVPDFWGMGYGTEVVGVALAFAFRTLKLDEVLAETQTANAASLGLLCKLGFVEIAQVQRFGAAQSILSIRRDQFTPIT